MRISDAASGIEAEIFVTRAAKRRRHRAADGAAIFRDLLQAGAHIPKSRMRS